MRVSPKLEESTVLWSKNILLYLLQRESKKERETVGGQKIEIMFKKM